MYMMWSGLGSSIELRNLKDIIYRYFREYVWWHWWYWN